MISEITVGKPARLKIIAERSFACYAVKVASATILGYTYTQVTHVDPILHNISTGSRALIFHQLYPF